VQILTGRLRFVHGSAQGVRHQPAPPAAREGAVAGDLAYEAEISCIYLAQLKKSTHFASLKIVGNLGIESAELLMATRKPSILLRTHEP
jgi:hypothetical protein